MSDRFVDPSRCPLCGGPNECGMVAGSSKCWCFAESIPAGVLERIPPEAQGLACVCRTCVTGQPREEKR